MIHILEKIHNHCLRSPEKPAHIFKDEILTYGELWEKSTALATWFTENFPRGVPIAVLGAKSQNMLITFLACTRSGRAYIPIDESTPDFRVEQIVKAAGAGALISTLDHRAPPTTVSLINRDELAKIYQKIVDTGKLSELLPVQAHENFYILFTSGSTGTPKGVQILRSNLEDFVTWTSEAYHYEKNPLYFLNQAPFSFDLSVYELYNSLISGGCIISLSHDQISDLKNLMILLKTHGTNLGVWVSTPSFLSLCTQDPSFQGKTFPALEHFVLIGEVFPKSLAMEVMARFPTSIVSNFYGPTEATVAHTVVDLTKEIIEQYPALPVGKCKPRSKIYIEDGEIILVGPNVSPGYINDAERTLKSFFLYEGECAYRTGDLGSINENGFLFFEARKDFQIKLNGFRIELGDIERHLANVSFVQDSCVIPQYKDGKVVFLCAFIVLRQGITFASKIELRKSVRAQLELELPYYMVPKNIIDLVVLPMTANGKIDRRALSQSLDSMA